MSSDSIKEWFLYFFSLRYIIINGIYAINNNNVDLWKPNISLVIKVLRLNIIVINNRKKP